MELINARVLITGASRGLGAVLADAFAARGAHLVLVARSQTDLESVRERVSKHGTQVFARSANVADRAARERMIEQVKQDLGGIDVLVNNAGLEHMGFYEDLTEQEIEDVIALNITAPMLLTRQVLPDMLARQRGHILNISSIAGLVPFAFGETYGSTKHGLVGFTRALRASLKERGSAVSASALCPGFVTDTGLYRDMRDRYGITPPRQLGRCTSAQVAAAAIHAIERDQPEVVVNSTRIREAAVFGVGAPRLAERVMRVMRVNQAAHRLAKRRREEREAATPSKATVGRAAE